MDTSSLKGMIRGRLEFDHPMAPETTYRAGGPASVLAEPEDEADVARVLGWAATNGVRTLFLGGGSNVLFADEGFEGVVIRPGEGLRSIRIEGDTVKAGAGVPLAAVLHKASESGLGGLEYCAGIPGTVGGAVIGNAGGKEGWVGERVQELTVVTPEGAVRVLPRDEVQWSYRHSSLKGSGLFLARVLLRLPKEAPDEARRKARQYWEARKTCQPLGKRNAGSTFKNPSDGFAGEMLEKAGLKGYRVGGACVSEVHSNFIDLEAEGCSHDVVAVMREMQKRVLEMTGIRLEPETLPLGDWKSADVADVWWNLSPERFR